jgi:hypothetical protein
MYTVDRTHTTTAPERSMTRPLVLAVLLALAPASVPAQAAAPDSAILATVMRLFDAMRARDTADLRAVFDSGARLVSAGMARDGTPALRVTTIDEFVRAIGGLTIVPDERIFEPEVRQDGGLATVWTRYAFYAGEQFSHCGVDAIQLGWTVDGWRIVALADTRRREGCPTS